MSSFLTIEITESVFLGDTHETDKRFAALKRLGVTTVVTGTQIRCTTPSSPVKNTR